MRSLLGWLLLCGVMLVASSSECLSRSAGDDESAFEKSLALAELGDPQAQLDVGYRYANGNGVNKDAVKALKWYLKAAEQGQPRAQYLLALMYDTGLGPVEKNKASSLSWLRKSADQGYAKAQFLLGLYYSNGLGVPKDKTIAFSYYKKAAEQGDAVAQHNLACMLEEGIGVEKNEVEAYAYFELAAASQQGAAQRLGALSKKMTEASCQAGKKRSLEIQNEMEQREQRREIKRVEDEAELKKRAMGA